MNFSDVTVACYGMLQRVVPNPAEFHSVCSHEFNNIAQNDYILSNASLLDCVALHGIHLGLWINIQRKDMQWTVGRTKIFDPGWFLLLEHGIRPVLERKKASEWMTRDCFESPASTPLSQVPITGWFAHSLCLELKSKFGFFSKALARTPRVTARTRIPCPLLKHASLPLLLPIGLLLHIQHWLRWPIRFPGGPSSALGNQLLWKTDVFFIGYWSDKAVNCFLRLLNY